MYKPVDYNKAIAKGQFESGLKNYEIAKSVGITKEYFSSLKNDPKKRPSTDLIEDLSELYGMKTSEFIALGESK